MPATLTPEQRTAVTARGLDPVAVEAKWTQQSVDRVFPATAKPAPTPSPVASPEAPTVVPARPARPVPSPKPRTAPSAPQRPVEVMPPVPVTPAPVARTAPAVPASIPMPAIASGRTRLNVTTQSDLERERMKMEQSRSQGPVIGPVEEREEEAAKLGTAIQNTLFTRGGTPDPITALAAQTPVESDSFVERVGRSLLPQTLATPGEYDAATRFDRAATGEAVEALRTEWSKTLASPLADKPSVATELQKRLASLDSDVANNPYVLSYKQEKMDWLANVAKHKEAGGSDDTAPTFKPTLSKSNVTTGKSYALRTLNKAMSSKSIGGEVVESPLAYVGRLVSAPVSAGVGAVEGAVTSAPIKETIPSRIKGGMGVMGAGLSISEAASDAAGLPKDDPARTASNVLGGGAGLIVDFLLPVVPGVGAVTKGLKSGAAAAATERALGATTAVVAGEALKRGTLSAVREGVPFASRFIAPELADDVVGAGLSKYANDASNKRNALELLQFSDELSSTGTLKQMESMNLEDKRKLLEEAYNKTPKQTSFAEFEKNIARTFDDGALYDVNFHNKLASDGAAVLTRATLDVGLSEASKSKLAEGAALSSDDLMTDVLRYIEESGGTTVGRADKTAPNAFTKEVLNQASILRFGVNPSKVKQGRTSVLKYMSGADDAAKDVVARHYLLNYGNQKLANAFFSTGTPAPKAGLAPTTRAGRYVEAAQDKLFSLARETGVLAEAFPDYVRLTKSSFVPQGEVASITKRFASSPIGELRDLVVAARKDGALDVVVPDELVDGIINMVAPTPLRYRVTPGRANTMNRRQAINELADIFKQTDDGKYLLDVAGYNFLAEKAMDSIASTATGYKSVFDVDADVRRLVGSDVGREAYINKVLTPKALNTSFVERGLVEGARKLGGDWLASSKAPTLSKEFSEAIGNKLAGIPEDFKTVFRTNRQSLEAPDAWAKTVVENYTRHLEKDVPSLAVADVSKLTEANHAQMFDDYVAMLYGGYESMVDAVSTTGKTLLLSDMPVLVNEMKQLAFLLSHHEKVAPFKAAFIDKARRGDMAGALLELRNVHAILQGRNLSFWFPNKLALNGLYDLANDTQRIYNTSIIKRPFELNGTTETRGIYDISEYAKDWSPMFLADDHVELLSAQYLARRQSAIVSDTYNEWARLYPSLMPTPEGISRNVSTFRDLLHNLHNQEPFFQGIINTIEGVGDIRRPVSVSMKTGTPELKPAAISADELDSFTFNKNLDHLDFPWPRAKNILPDLASSLYNETLNALDMNKMYLSLLQDKMAKLASSEATSNAYSTYMMAVSKNLIDDIMKRTFGTLEGEASIIPDLDPVKGAKVDAAVALREAMPFHWTVTADDLDSMTQTFKLNSEAVSEARMYLEVLFRQMFLTNDAVGRANLFAGTDAYVRTVYPQLTREGGRAFYDTLVASIENGMTANTRVLTQGPIEQATNIPLTLGSKDVVTKAMLQRGGIEQFTEAMENMAVTGKGTKLSDPAIASQMDVAIKEGLAATRTLREGSGAKQQRLARVISEFTGTPSNFFEGGLTSFAKGSVLGGNILPNFRYLVNNFLTAPAIIGGTIGGDFASNALKGLVFGDVGVNDTMRVLVGSDRFFGGLTDIGTLRGKNVAAETVVVTTPTGKVYTNYDLAQLAQEGSLSRSQASAELTTAVIKDLSSWANLNKGKVLAPDITGYSTIKNDGLGSMMKDLLGMKSGRGMNVYQELGNMSDTMFRLGVLKKALGEGMEEAQALRVAREALFDYGNMTSFERNYVSKVFWFWNFRRNSYRNVMKTFLTNPSRFKNLYAANGYMENLDRDTNFATQDYVEYRPFLHLMEDKSNRTRYSLYGPATPQLQGTAEMLDYLSFVVPLLNDKKSVTEVLTTSPLSTVAEMSSPGLQTALGLYLGVDARREGKAIGYYLDPRLMWYLQQNPDMWNMFSSYVRVEAVAPEDVNPSQGTFQGQQWRIQKGDTDSVRNWFAIQQLLIYTGLQRNLRDYAPMFSQGTEREGVAATNMGAGSALQAAMTFGGVVTPITMPTYEERLELNRRVISEQFRSKTFKQD